MKKNTLNEEISRIRKMIGLNEGEDFDLSSVDNPNAYTDDIVNHNAEKEYVNFEKDYDSPEHELDEIGESDISEGSMESGVYYDTTVAYEIKSKVGNLHKIAPYVLEIGDRVIEDISGKVSVYDGDKLIEKFSDVDAFLVGIKYGATPI
jgi:hypothetical protein